MFVTSLIMSSRLVFSLLSTGLWYFWSIVNFDSFWSRSPNSYFGQSSSTPSRYEIELCTVSFRLFNNSDVLSSSGDWFVFFLDFLVLAGATNSLHTPSKKVMMPMNCKIIIITSQPKYFLSIGLRFQASSVISHIYRSLKK